MRVSGKFIYLKRINLKDAYFVFKLRNKKRISMFLTNRLNLSVHKKDGF